MSAPNLAPGVLDQIHDHVRSTTDREVGGFLVGSLVEGDDPKTRIVAAIPALKAVGASANVTFTHDVWDEALATVDRDHPGQRIVGWYHSHPDFGVFLSEYDLFIHRNFFPLPAMMALVVDPVRGEAGWFTTVGEGVEQVDSYTIQPVRSASAKAAEETAERSRSGSVWLYGLAAALVAFAVGWAVSPDGESGDEAAVAAAEERAVAAEDRVEDLERQLADALTPSTTASDGATGGQAGSADGSGTDSTSDGSSTGQGTDAGRGSIGTPGSDGGEAGGGLVAVYTVQAGDSLWRISERFFGDGARWTALAEANGVVGGSIEPGMRLVLPGLIDGTAGATLEVSPSVG